MIIFELMAMDDGEPYDEDSKDASEAKPPSSKHAFMKLVDYLAGEEQKKIETSDPQFQSKLIRIAKYKDIQSRKYEQDSQQKGVQINKAA